MKTLLRRFVPASGRMLLTLLIVAGGVVAGRSLWAYYMDAPWTRDGRVRADVVTIAPDVSGLVSQVLVRDNQTVRQGDVLFRIDPDRFQLALQEAQAAVASRKAELDEAQREATRVGRLSDLSVSRELLEQRLAKLETAAAGYRQSLADQAVAALNLKRSAVISPVNGTVTNVDLEPGDYVTVGHGVMALVDAATLRVEGYFEETKLSKIHPGDRARVLLMGDPRVLTGHVQSIATGIADRERMASADLLPDINPTFNWVRLAQRVPVRIRLDDVPKGVDLVVGRTATVVIEAGTAPTREPGAAPVAAAPDGHTAAAAPAR